MLIIPSPPAAMPAARVLEDLRTAVQRRIEEVDSYLQLQGLYTLRTWQDEELLG
jgi:hypothetical protein